MFVAYRPTQIKTLNIDQLIVKFVDYSNLIFVMFLK